MQLMEKWRRHEYDFIGAVRGAHCLPFSRYISTAHYLIVKEGKHQRQLSDLQPILRHRSYFLPFISFLEQFLDTGSGSYIAAIAIIITISYTVTERLKVKDLRLYACCAKHGGCFFSFLQQLILFCLL